MNIELSQKEIEFLQACIIMSADEGFHLVGSKVSSGEYNSDFVTCLANKLRLPKDDLEHVIERGL